MPSAPALRYRSPRFVGRNGQRDVFRVAIPVVPIYQDREVARGHDVAGAGRLFGEPREVDVRITVARAGERKPADLIRVEAGALNEPGGQRIVRSRAAEVRVS